MSILRECGENAKILVFCTTKKGCEILQRQLESRGFRSMAIHGNKSQQERDYTMNRFREGRVKIMIATDVASRGLDVKDIEFVINFDMPKTIEDYVHRIGRTGRAGAFGTAITFFDENEDFRLAKDLISVMKEANMHVPHELSQVASTIKERKNKQSQNNNSQPQKRDYNSWNNQRYSNNYNKPNYDYLNNNHQQQSSFPPYQPQPSFPPTNSSTFSSFQPNYYWNYQSYQQNKPPQQPSQQQEQSQVQLQSKPLPQPQPQPQSQLQALPHSLPQPQLQPQIQPQPSVLPSFMTALIPPPPASQSNDQTLDKPISNFQSFQPIWWTQPNDNQAQQ